MVGVTAVIIPILQFGTPWFEVRAFEFDLVYRATNRALSREKNTRRPRSELLPVWWLVYCIVRNCQILVEKKVFA